MLVEQQLNPPYNPDQFVVSPVLDRPELHLFDSKETLVRVGNIAIATRNWGIPFTRDQYRNRLEQEGLLPKEMDDFLLKSGLSGGWHYPENLDVKSDEVQQLHALNGAAVALQAIKARGWDSVDVLTFSSVSSRRETTERIKEILMEEGIDVSKTEFYGMACAGGSVSMTDKARDKNLKGKRVVNIGLEGLSGSQIRHEDITDIGLEYTFGVGAGAVAFVPGEDIKHYAGTRWVEKDTNMITLDRIYGLPPEEDRLPREQWPSWYRIADEETAKMIAFAKDGSIIMLMPTDPNTPYAHMNGRSTIEFFAPKTAQHIAEFFAELLESNDPEMKSVIERLPQDLGYVIQHQPSKPVNIFTKKLYEGLRKKNPNLPEIQFSWLMEETGVNNVSAATALFHMAELAKRGLLVPGKLTPVISLGVGSVIGVDLIEINHN